MRQLFNILFFLSLSLVTYAQSFTLEVDVPRVVAVGEPFRVEFKMNEKPENFSHPSFEGFDLIAGPSVSQSTQMSIVNGKTTRSSLVTYSYVIVANNKGNFTIGAASATKGGKTYKSGTATLEVVGGEAAAQSGSSEEISTSGGVAKDDVLLLLDLSKRSVYKGEAIVASIKLLTRAQIVSADGAKYPSFNGFWTQEINVDQRQQTDWVRVNYNDKVYDCAVLREYLLFPQQDGEIVVDPMSMNVTLRIADANASRGNAMFESFFGGGGSFRDIKRQLSTQRIAVKVKPYPQPIPLNFSGAVGDFQMSSSISSDIITANSSSNIVVSISGVGNLPLITEPTLELPSSFELYKVKTEEKLGITEGGVRGDKIFTYPFIARANGKYEIPSVEFTYFNVAQNRFITLNGDPLQIAVSTDTSSQNSGSGEKIISGVTKEELKILGRDISYIMTSSPALVAKDSMFIWSMEYYLILLALLILFVVMVIVLKKMIKESNDIVKVKSKRATRVAFNRLKEAKSFLDSGSSGEFYESVLRAMWGYIGDKLNLDNAKLSRENVSEKLISKGVNQSEIDQFIAVISSCEEARYSPVASSMMGDVYGKATEVITLMENKL